MVYIPRYFHNLHIIAFCLRSTLLLIAIVPSLEIYLSQEFSVYNADKVISWRHVIIFMRFLQSEHMDRNLLREITVQFVTNILRFFFTGT